MACGWIVRGGLKWPGIVRGRVEAHEAVVLAVDETLARSGVVVHDPSDSERVDVAEATFAGRTTRVGLLVVLPGQVVPEAVVRYRYSVVGLIVSSNRRILTIVRWRFQQIAIEGRLLIQVVVIERKNQRFRSRS